MDKVFVDTNVLVYSVDSHVPSKRKRARELLESLVSEGCGVVSTQVMQEFYVAVTRKLEIEELVAKDMLNSLRDFEVVTVQVDFIREAIDCSILNQLSFWDSLIVVAAEKARCSTIWSEDLGDGQVIRGSWIENPFKEIKGGSPVKESRVAYHRQPKKRVRKSTGRALKG